MRPTKYLLSLALLATGLVTNKAFAQRVGQESSFERRHDETDTKPVREFVQSKENIEIKEKATELEISGDVRFEWRHMHEKGKRVFIVDRENTGTGAGTFSPALVEDFAQKYTTLRGHDVIDNRFFPVSNNDWDVEFNLKFKYTYKRAWAAAHLQFDNPAGIRGYNDCFTDVALFRKLGSSSSPSFTNPDFASISLSELSDYSSSRRHSSFSSAGSPISGSNSEDRVIVLRDNRRSCKGSGESSFINLKRAYMGYNVYADGTHRVDVEIGRRKLDDLFDSEIQFSSRFDGIAFKYATDIKEYAAFFFDAAAFIIDERVNDIGYAFEFGFLDIMGSGLDLKYSFIDWTGRNKNRCFIRHPLGSQFKNSQFTYSYTILPEIFCKKIPVEFYGAFVINHAAKKTIFTHHKRKNFGLYNGILVGEINKEGDWSFDITYEYIQAQMASDCDVNGIGRGNILDERLTDILYLPDSSEFILPRRGNGNFKGWSFEFIYALTDNLSLDFQYEFTRAEDSRIGGRHHYTNAEFEAIYAF